MFPKINDRGDLLLRIKATKKRFKEYIDDDKGADNVEIFGLDDENIKELYEMKEKFRSTEGRNCSIFMFIPHETNHECQTFIYWDSPTDSRDKIRDCSMNLDYYFIWNISNVWKCDLKTGKFTPMKINISKNEEETWITNVRTGSDEKIVNIRIRQTKTTHFIVMWDLERDIEIESFDIDSNAIFF